MTGAASGIGRAVAAALVDAGAQVLAVDLEPDPAGPGEPFAADLTTRDGNRAAVAAAVDAFGGLDTIVANAGFQHVAPIAEFDEDRWDGLLALLLTSPFLLARYGWEALGASGEGRFIAVASAHSLVASPFKAGYVSAKHGVLGLVKTLALEGAEHGITRDGGLPGVRAHAAGRGTAGGPGRGARRVRGPGPRGRHPRAARRQAPDRAGRGGRRRPYLLGPGGSAFTGAPLIMDAGWTAR